MSDTWTNPFKSFFFAGDNKNTPQALRQKIALAMLMQKRAHPKTFGEGLSAIGDAIGNRSITRQIEGEAGEAERAAAAARSEILGASPPAATALDAVNRAATPQAPIVPATPPSARPVTTGPSGGAAPVAAGPGGVVDPGDFNEIDAADPRNRYKPPPPYLAAALDRNVADPERRGYLGQLAGKEAQRPNEVSPTGAAGPFQFTRGTGAQYGIPGNARFDPDASTVAANRLTDDNAATLRARLGREPTPGELALAHQQGAGTGANMLTGAGNAPPRNLAVNNVPPGTPPQAAAAKVMGYYNMPGATGVPPSPRDGVAAALTAQQEPPPPAPGRPTVADYGQKLALAPTPPAQEIAQAPPAAPPIRQAPPPQQVAQAQPGYVLDLPPAPQSPPTMTPQMQKIQNMIANAPPAQRDSVREALTPLYAQEEAKLSQAQAAYKDQLTQHRALQLEQERQRATAAERTTTYDKATSEADIKREEARIVSRTGMEPKELYKRLDEEKASVDQTTKAQSAQQLARKAIRDGVITGYGANMRIAKDKFADWAFNNGMKGDLAANTEIMQSALSVGLSEAIKTVNGEGGAQVSNADVKIAQGMAGSDPNLQMKTIQSIMDRAAEINHRKIDKYEAKVDHYLSGEKAEFNYKTGGSTVPPDKLKILLDNPEQMKSKFDEVYGPGAANLEIARFKRAQRRQGRD